MDIMYLSIKKFSFPKEQISVYLSVLKQFTLSKTVSGDKNISILHSPCRTSDLQFSLVLQTHALVLKSCLQKRKWGGDLMFLNFLINYMAID